LAIRMRINKTLKKEIVALCKKYGVKYRIRLQNDSLADVNLNLVIIGYGFKSKTINRENFRQYMLSVTCHEICHILAAREGKFKIYHLDISSRAMSESELRATIQTGWRAEKYVDRRAKEILRANYPDLKYMGYRQADKPSYDKFLDGFRKELEWRKHKNRKERDSWRL